MKHLDHARPLVGPAERETHVQDWRGLFSRVLLVSSFWTLPICAAQQLDYSQQAELDDKGNIYVSSDEGKLIWMSDTKHCSEATVANDRQTVGCRVAARVQGQKPQDLAPTLQLEIYLKGGKKKTIGLGAPILDWHFWNDGQQVEVHSGPRHGRGSYALYESATARLVDKLAEPADESSLPQWAKSPAQIADESVPISSALTQERTDWVAKILRQIGKIEPGMQRKDLFTVLTTEGGISNRFQRTYVHLECPYIRVNVRFKATSNESDALREDPEDIIESVSPPYLAWRTMD